MLLFVHSGIIQAHKVEPILKVRAMDFLSAFFWQLTSRSRRRSCLALRVRVLFLFGIFTATTRVIGLDLILTRGSFVRFDFWIFIWNCVSVAASTLPRLAAAVQSCCKVHAAILVAVHRRACTSSPWKLSLYSRHWMTDCAKPTPCLSGVVPVVSGFED